MNLLYNDNCLNVLKKLPDNSIDTCITDPPYGLNFMGKEWDHGVPSEIFWTEILRVCKPGAILMAFGGTRTFHRLMVAIENSGWELRDTCMWVYGSGMPKGLNISKGIDKKLGVERKVVGVEKHAPRDNSVTAGQGKGNGDVNGGYNFGTDAPITEPATDQAKLWDGYNTQLKPAYEPIIVAMKPLDGSFVDNALKWGVAGYNIDECRVGKREKEQFTSPKRISAFGGDNQDYKNQNFYEKSTTPLPEGRYPANFILSYPENEYTIKDDITPKQLLKLAEWINENT